MVSLRLKAIAAALMLLTASDGLAAPLVDTAADVESLCVRGDSLLASGDLEGAEDAYRAALKGSRDAVPALIGLGRVFQETPHGLRWAVKYFKQAAVADRANVRAYQHLAEVYRQLGDTKELTTYERIVRIEPSHPDAWYQIGRIRRDGIASRYRDDEKAEEALRRQVEVNPNHTAARLSLSDLLREEGDTDGALVVLEPVLDATGPEHRRIVLALARVYQKRRQYDLAEQMFDAYIRSLDERERQVYYDLSLVLNSRDLSAFRKAGPSEWKALADRFWAGQDPAPLTAANERRIEHCRRVAYAREHFGAFEFPWDARGETYVRFGEPDHVSSSEDIRFETRPRAVAVKERLYRMAGTATGALLQARAGQLDEVASDGAVGAASTIQRQIEGTGHYLVNTPAGVVVKKAKGAGSMGPSGTGIMDDSPALLRTSSILGWPVYPVLGRVWEYWIYTDVGPGIEVTFTQSYFPGPYDFAEPPHGIGAADRSIELTWQRMNPRVVVDAVSAGVPQRYRPDFATGPLDFYFDTAQFRGDAGGDGLEIYFGIPVAELTYIDTTDGRQAARVAYGAALYARDGGPVRRSRDSLNLVSAGPADAAGNAFIPALNRVAVTPGTYRLSVQVQDPNSGRSQVYNQTVEARAFPETGLALSDIQLAASVTQADRGRFLKGEVNVVPNPTRAYLPGQPVSIYYEIYNLSRDAFGATHYRVQYEVRSLERQPVIAGIASAIGRLLGREEEREAIRVAYEHTGERTWEQGYLSIDMAGSEPGDYRLSVRVTDAADGGEAVGAAVFQIR